ncbi:MAG: glycosyltransferase family 4 protein [Micrococcus sp.]|nr:glycosyltransferase family 4 protein [Micrococcus sp.]
MSSAHPWTDNRVHLREAAALAKAGYDVGLYAIDNDLEAGNTGVRVARVPRSGRLSRIVVGSARAVRAALASRAEVVHLHDPELMWAVPVLQAAGRTVIYDAHEDLPSQVMHKPYLPTPVRRPVAWATRALLAVADRADGVIAATETVARRFKPDHTTVVRNYPQHVEGSEPVPVERRSNTVVYVGGLSAARGMDELVEACADPGFPAEWRVSLAGPGSETYVASLAQRPGWTRVDFHGLVAPLEARRLVGEAKVGLVVLRDTPNHREALPTKMFEYMASGTPVIASDFPLWRQILTEHDCGLLVDPTRPSEIAQAIRRYAQDPELLERHSRNALVASRGELNWEAESVRLVEAYRALGVHPPHGRE